MRSALALALAVGLMPAQALSTLALAAESAPETAPAEQQASSAQPEDIVAKTVKLGDEGASADGADAASNESSASSAASTDQKNMQVPVAGAAGASAGEAATSAEDAEVDIVSASVKLGASSTIIGSNGLSFSVDEAAHTATLVGIANNALAGELAIPAEVSAGYVAYKVTNISAKGTVGGGSLI